MNQQIHCIVSDCNYWSQGNMCKANEIIVTTDQFGNSQPDRVDAKVAKQLTPTTAGSCMATCCKTYATKGFDKTHADNINRMS